MSSFFLVNILMKPTSVNEAIELLKCKVENTNPEDYVSSSRQHRKEIKLQMNYQLF